MLSVKPHTESTNHFSDFEIYRFLVSALLRLNLQSSGRHEAENGGSEALRNSKSEV